MNDRAAPVPPPDPHAAPDPAAYGDDLAATLRASGSRVVPAEEFHRRTGTAPQAWASFARHWEKLAPDPYAAARGTRRLRRYGAFTFDAVTGEARPTAHTPFVQPEASNPLYVDVRRDFEPLTGAFLADPVLHTVLGLLGRAATGLESHRRWLAKVHPFRVLASPGDAGEPTPEGMHRDGVTLVSSLLVGRANAEGGQSTVTRLDGRPVLSTTLAEPGALLVGDDRGTLHGVSPLRPRDVGRPARRDVLVATFAPA
ncbi:2OG-Fe dioxygenase family protein [Streptomyces sp. Z26]|uniref:2OG-Fe dioxygenase family protein n=1 Tax=Streptomyces sp. Z26 TaxID=2500177 RepID=UPI000EF16CB6|nr:2OG-Fe dioxygenase family protein [Streptomyces sp. Z26]RLL69785.1 hypothetical protein D7M15_26600 [Streptomyces sp. Z26]